MDLRRCVERLGKALREPLPGTEAHRHLAALPRRGWVPGHVPGSARPAAVLLLLYPRGGETWIPLTLRAADMETHQGQVSLPGGALDPGEAPRDGALREAEEELGVPPASVRLLGPLSTLHVPVSGYAVHPLVGVCGDPPAFRPEPAEVERVLEVPLAELGRGGAVRQKRASGREVPYFTVHGCVVWGATAMILAELLHVLGYRPWRGEGGGEESDGAART